MRKLSQRVAQDSRLWGVNIHDQIREWIPRQDENVKIKWIDQPFWADKLPVATRVTMKERTIEDPNGPIIQWELSNDTIKNWALLLAAVIEQVKLAVRDAEKQIDQRDTSQIC